jgi:hypothetical protein
VSMTQDMPPRLSDHEPRDRLPVREPGAAELPPTSPRMLGGGTMTTDQSRELLPVHEPGASMPGRRPGAGRGAGRRAAGAGAGDAAAVPGVVPGRA